MYGNVNVCPLRRSDRPCMSRGLVRSWNNPCQFFFTQIRAWQIGIKSYSPIESSTIGG